MQYFVITPTGQQFGPADFQTLTQWVQEGRIEPSTMLQEVSTGRRVPASSVPGIAFPAAVPNVGLGTQPVYQPVQPTSYGSDNGENDLRTAWLLGVIGLVGSYYFALLCTILAFLNVFSIFGVIHAVKAKKKGSQKTRPALIVSIVGLVLGPAIWLGLMAFFQFLK